MTNEQILKLLELNKIEELKKELMSEIIAKNSKNKNQYKSILKLSKIAEKEQRNKYYGKKEDGTYVYISPQIAGAWYENNTTNICNGYWALKSNKIIDGLQLAPKCMEYLNLDKIIPYSDLKKENETNININQLIETVKAPTKEFKTYETNQADFNAEALYNLYKCFNCEELKVYLLENMIVLKDSENIGILLKLRNKKG